ncbi:MAG: hypothetical protein KME28_25785 [Pelatocladus maniniholoensis HA4357-MV3]|jgi:hypothetical protein|uniref:Uncharacterized protein n=1 Tax=Pelatocladus maniniholoensis HA4357-MV3 TaxID=1117104 RepID=A0A9E3LWR1_9NOST|nr:hypothetical protein [Pelatocladus maniniholoensis HA4357-MV3]BAZ68484.1 hypothetical protein NIES4106_32480 [Fischerella sp. NIES-4106]
MHLQEQFIQYLAAENLLNQTIHSEVKVEDRRVDISSIPSAKIFIAGGSLAFIIIWAVFLVFMSKMRRLSQENKLFFAIHTSRKVPCRKCHYFSQNHHLNCAVQPSIVLTEEASNCPDYCPKQGKASQQKSLTLDD